MADLNDLTGVAGTELNAEQIQGILNQIDLDILNLARDGKLAALKYAVPGSAGAATDRASNLRALLEARKHYEQLLREFAARETPAWITTPVSGDDERLG